MSTGSWPRDRGDHSAEHGGFPCERRRPVSAATAVATGQPRRSVPRAWHLIERNLFVYRRTWTIIVSGFFEPLFYLVGIGFGLGRLVGDVTGPAGQPIPYAVFIAPALLATGAMNGAVAEATFNFFFKLNFNRTFQSILATPLSVRDVAVGEIAWALIRGGLYAIGFMMVIAVLGLVRSPWAVLAVPAALLLGFATGAVGMAATSFMRSPTDFDLINIIVLPMFLFSATFYPIETYPEAIRGIVAFTPLYQGVALIRGLTVGVIGPEMLIHVVYLLAMGFIGLWVTSRRLDRILLK
ncbi:MAG: ABC transporter permease [Chloroflexi bacterium]|nr:ABC transporter permease [Chloroflexota bacterium]